MTYHSKYRNDEYRKFNNDRYKKRGVSKQAHINKAQYIESRCGHACEICGEQFCSDVFQFHHRVPSEKNFGLSQSRWRGVKKVPDKTLLEAEKCVILCPTCHAFEHIALKRGETLLNDQEAYSIYRNHRFSGNGSVDDWNERPSDTKQEGVLVPF